MYNLGLTAYKQGSPESAIIFFKRACDIDPNLADAQYNLGMLFQSEKRAKEAAPRYLEVLRVKPLDPDAHYQLGLCYIDMGQSADARTQFQTIAPNNPHFADAQKRLSMIDAGAGASPPVGMPDTGNQQLPVNDSTRVTGAIAPTQTYASPQLGTLSPPITGASASQNEIGTPQINPYQGNSAAETASSTTAPPGVLSSQPQATSQSPQESTHEAAQPSLPANNVQSMATTNLAASDSAPNPQSRGPQPTLTNAAVRVIATGFSAPAGLSFDRQGNLYVANFLTSTVDRINVDGSRERFCSGANLKGPIGLVVDGTNNIYIANYQSGTVAKISPSGVSTVIATGFKKPYYLALDKDGNLFVSQQEDNSVVRISLPKATAARPQ
jgi:hypothetical protein